MKIKADTLDEHALSLFEQPKKRRLQEQIAEQVKKLIFSRKIAVGQKLPSDRDLAKIFCVSRVVVREALLSLQQAGFIEIKPGTRGGSYVTDNIYKPLLDSIFDLFRDGSLSLEHFLDARSYIEQISVKLAVENISDAAIKNLEEINNRFVESDLTSSMLAEENLKFHLALADIGGNPLIKLFIGSIWKMQKIIYEDAYLKEGLYETSYNSHKEIIKALKARDVDLAVNRMNKDISLHKNLNIDPSDSSFLSDLNTQENS